MLYFKTAELINSVSKTVHAPHCFIESRFSLSLRVMLGIRLRWSSTHLPTQLSISDRTAGSLAPESNRSFALSLQCIVHLVRRSWEGKETIWCVTITRNLLVENWWGARRVWWKVTTCERISHKMWQDTHRILEATVKFWVFLLDVELLFF